VNPALPHSQAIGGMVGSIGMALMEHAVMDRRSGRIVNASFAEYLVPVNADIPALDPIFLDERDPHVNPLDVKSLGELTLMTQGMTDGDTRADLLKLAVRKIMEEALEAEVAEAVGRDYYGGKVPSWRRRLTRASAG
jgi:hypothetical protein